jgi:ABC-2 type transport system permease protein
MQEALKFLAIMVTGVTASILLGAAIGMSAKNRQAATSLGMPVAMLVGFTPMVAGFNESVERFARFLYTQQISVIVNDFTVSLWQPLLVIAGNIAILAVLFAAAYRKNGLKG